MQAADIRLSNLRDLLHHAGLPPMTEQLDQDNPELVMKPRTKMRAVKLVGKKRDMSLMGSCTQFTGRMTDEVRLIIMIKISDTTRFDWAPPFKIAQQMSVTMMNRNVPKNDTGRMVNVTLRAVQKFHGKRHFSDVKIACPDDDGRDHIYFAR